MEREDIENSLKVLSHIVDDDFIITVDEARKIIGIDGETIDALQAEVQFYKALVYEWQSSAENKERLLGLYRAEQAKHFYSAMDDNGRIITNPCARMNIPVFPDSSENPNS